MKRCGGVGIGAAVAVVAVGGVAVAGLQAVAAALHQHHQRHHHDHHDHHDQRGFHGDAVVVCGRLPCPRISQCHMHLQSFEQVVEKGEGRERGVVAVS